MTHQPHDFFLPEFREKRGFTIVELLVAVGITAAMAAIMLAMTTNIMSSWSRASGSLSAQTQARTALDYLQRDLERAIFRRDGNVWFAVDTLNAPGDVNLWQSSARGKPENSGPGQQDSHWDPQQDRFGWAGVWLRFFTSDPDVNAVSYQIVRRTPVKSTATQQEIDTRARYMLYRSKVGSEATFLNGYDILVPEYNPGADLEGTAEGATERGDPEAREVQRPSRESLLASNVVDFGIRLLWKTVDSAGDPFYMEIYPDPGGGPGDGSLPHRSPALPGQSAQPQDESTWNYGTYSYSPDPTGATSASSRIPNVAEITIRVLTDQGATELTNFEAGRIEGEWWDIVEEHSKIFTRRVVLQNAPVTR